MADANLAGILAKYLVGWHLQRIETGSTGKGIPDLSWAHGGCEGWIENKQTTSWKVKMNGPEQVSWPERRARAGGRYSMVVRHLGRNRDDLWILDARAPRLLIDGARLDELPKDVVRFWMGCGPANWEWSSIARILKRVDDPVNLFPVHVR